MANTDQVKLLGSGAAAWNAWQRQNPGIRPDLRAADLGGMNLGGAILIEADLAGANLEGTLLKGADLSGADMTGANLSKADLREADLQETILVKANLCKARLADANLTRADLTGANVDGAKLNSAFLPEATLLRATLIKADCSGAILSGADMRWVDLSGAKLTGANLIGAQLVGSYLNSANLNNCRVYGISAWDLRLDDKTRQQDLVITPSDQSTITVDSIEIAQFIYLLLNNAKIRQVIDAITSKVVLILGRFSERQKGVLDAIREELRHRDFTPILFDFDKPASKDLTGTVETLARMARFIIADLTDPSSIPHELATLVPFLRTTPVLPLRLAGSGGYTMFDDLARSYRWVLKVHEYTGGKALVADLPGLIDPADKMAEKFRKERPDAPRPRS